MTDKELERQLKCLANRRRLAILRYLQKTKESNVESIAAEIKLSFKATSKHLNILAGQDVIEREQKSTRAFYSIAKDQRPLIFRILSLL